ncbi:MAG: hypothetical protein LBH81_02300 [Rickettsiales bacterium]|jgi:hypothetical protein|nr:hypothetical protein [Rickettsiales bacterium]
MVRNIAKRKSLQDHQEDALYREVWEEVRIQKFYAALRSNLRLILAAAVIIISAVVVVQIIRHNNEAKLKTEVLAYESAMAMAAERQFEGAEVLLMRMAEKSSGGMGDLARFRAAQIDLANGRESEGIAKLENLAKNGATKDFKHLAVIKIAATKAKTMDAKAFERMLAPLLTKRSPFYFTAMLMVAMKHAEEGNNAQARSYADKIAGDKNAPGIIAAQAEALSVFLQ